MIAAFEKTPLRRLTTVIWCLLWVVAIPLLSFFGTGYPALSIAHAKDVSKPFSISIRARPIRSFRIGDPERTRFGALEFIGGLELIGDSEHFGGLSGLAFDAQLNRMVAVADTGFWFTGILQTDTKGRPTGISDAMMAPMLSSSGDPIIGKWDADAESIKIMDEAAYVSFERNNRIVRFSSPDTDTENTASGLFAARALPVPPSFAGLGLRGNKGLEAIALRKTETGLEMIVISERSLNPNGHIRAFIVSKGKRKEFAITYSDEFDATDAAFLENGDLLLLERRFNMASGVALRLRRLSGTEIKPGAVATGMVLMQADMSYQIDNMEGLDVHRNAKGETIISMISDDNYSILQRNMFLQFKLMEGDFVVVPEKRSQ